MMKRKSWKRKKVPKNGNLFLFSFYFIKNFTEMFERIKRLSHIIKAWFIEAVWRVYCT